MVEKRFSLPFFETKVATSQQGINWFCYSLRKIFSIDFLVVFGLLILGASLSYAFVWIPFGGTIINALISTICFIWIIERYFTQNCSIQNITGKISQRIVDLILLIIFKFALLSLLSIIVIIISLLLFSSEIYDFCKELYTYIQSEDLAIEDIASHAIEYGQNIVTKGGGAFIFHIFIVFSLSLLSSLVYFMFTCFALPLVLYGEVSAFKAMTTSFIAFNKNWLAITVASLAFLVLILLGVSFLGAIAIFAFGISSLIDGGASLMVLLLSYLTGALAIPMLFSEAINLFMSFVCCRDIFWSKYDTEGINLDATSEDINSSIETNSTK